MRLGGNESGGAAGLNPSMRALDLHPGSGGLFFRGEQPNVGGFAVDNDERLPALSIPIGLNASQSALGRISAHPDVPHVLLVGRNPKVRSPIVESVPVHVIALKTRIGKAENFPVHQNDTPWAVAQQCSPYRVDKPAVSNQRVPLMLSEVGVFVVDEGRVAPRERDEHTRTIPEHEVATNFNPAGGRGHF